MFLIFLKNLVLERKTENKKYINYNFVQYHNNLEVIDSRLYAKLNLSNQIVAFGLDVFSDISIDLNPSISTSSSYTICKSKYIFYNNT